MTQLIAMTSARVLVASKHAALAAIGAAALSLFSMTASAELPDPQQQVDFDDLNLESSQDTERLYRRLRTASLNVCSEFRKSRSVVMRERHRDCVNNALSDAVETIGHPSLTALHAAKHDTKLAQRKMDSVPRS
ncbi:MAG TPA: UrcA family protein [Steroidobacteraceae bacterium]|nr:UrcA family protein [Steroidobacteraceae bacterium]